MSESLETSVIELFLKRRKNHGRKFSFKISDNEKQENFGKLIWEDERAEKTQKSFQQQTSLFS